MDPWSDGWEFAAQNSHQSWLDALAAIRARRMTLHLDPATVRFCAAMARAAADGLPVVRAHHGVAAAALRVLGEELDALCDGEVVASGGVEGGGG